MATETASRWDPLMIVLGGVILQYVWRVQEVFPQLAKVQFTALVSVGALVLFMTDTHRARRLAFLQHRLYLPVLAIFAVAILSVPMSVHTGVSVEFLTGNFVKTVILVGIIAASIRDRNDVERLLRVLVLGGAGYVLASILLGSGVGRLGGQGSYDPNDLGLHTVSTIPLAFYLLRRGARPWERAAAAAAVVLLLVGTVQTGSRGGFIALVAVSGYGLLGFSVVNQSKRLALLVVAGSVMIAAAGGAYWDRMGTILHADEDYNWAGQAEGGRMEVWKRGLGYMVRRPLTGVGVYAFPVAEGTLAPQAARQEIGIGWRWSAAHSSYVQIGAETGVFGLAAFVTLLVLAFREARRIGRRALDRRDRLLGQAFGGLVVGFAVGCAFLSQAYATYLYFSLGLLIGLSRVVARQTAPAPVRGARRRRSATPPAVLHPVGVAGRPLPQ